ncbi:transcriptional regulatory protein [Rhodovulum sp. PH10]|nr:transcriptional regulatory protein [Rhodovulum sp. PH10]
MMSFGDIDLKLLKVLHVVLSERSVTRASERLGRSQPAVSNALRRLRDLLGDELLVRGPNGLVLTPRAQALERPLGEAMALVEGCLFDGDRFDPADASGVFRISAPDRLSVPVVPSLLDRLQRFAPRLRLHAVTADRNYALELLDRDVVELAVGTFAKLPHHFNSETIVQEGFLCVVRKGHPLLKPQAHFDMAAVLSYPHVVVSAAGRDSFFDDLLEGHGLSRNILARVTTFNAVPHLLMQGEAIGIFTKLASQALAASFGFVTRPVPMDVGRIATALAWHVRNEQDKKHIWLRQEVKAICHGLKPTET